MQNSCMPLSLMPLSFIPHSSFIQIELCLSPLCHFLLCQFPVWNKMNYASFLYASFRLCPFSGLMEIVDYAGFLYANFRAPRPGSTHIPPGEYPHSPPGSTHITPGEYLHSTQGSTTRADYPLTATGGLPTYRHVTCHSRNKNTFVYTPCEFSFQLTKYKLSTCSVVLASEKYSKSKNNCCDFFLPWSFSTWMIWCCFRSFWQNIKDPGIIVNLTQKCQ
jgi:hypothetical protein